VPRGAWQLFALDFFFASFFFIKEKERRSKPATQKARHPINRTKNKKATYFSADGF
jgi:hypothetical protein